ncbi:type II secretion system protein N [Kordiimonas marina]|uniref:type II secretion system protein N n=1 Tax=Kordiimonas marina TaxID=2872312 RepID=UPI001FF13500|nr:type II secretion system protein N [Kordiimonas marina]MCJ9430044.1 hypothetical protein [Kordiimonas marina]
MGEVNRPQEKRGAQLARAIEIALGLLLCAVAINIGCSISTGLWPPQQEEGVAKARPIDTGDSRDGPLRFDMLATTQLFGRSIASADPGTQLAVTETSLDVSLHGLRVASDGSSSAIIKTPDGQETPYRVGDELTPGVRVIGIYNNYILISRGGKQERLFLDCQKAEPSTND